MTTFNWTISTLEYDVQPAAMEGCVVTAHWRCSATDTVAEVAYNASSYGTCGFSSDPSAPGYIAYADLTEADVLSWCWEAGIDKDATEASLQANIDLQISPVTASGTPWATAS